MDILEALDEIKNITRCNAKVTDVQLMSTLNKKDEEEWWSEKDETYMKERMDNYVRKKVKLPGEEETAEERPNKKIYTTTPIQEEKKERNLADQNLPPPMWIYQANDKALVPEDNLANDQVKMDDSQPQQVSEKNDDSAVNF